MAADLMANLPYGAATWARLDDMRAWSPEAHLAALQLDTFNSYLYSMGAIKGRRPKPIQRPGVEAERNGRNDVQGVTDKQELLDKLSRPSIGQTT